MGAIEPNCVNSNCKYALDGPFKFIDYNQGYEKKIEKIIDPDTEKEISEWLLTRRIWWFDLNTYAPQCIIMPADTGYFSLDITYDGSACVLNYKTNPNGNVYLQYVAFMDKKIQNILDKIREENKEQP